MPTTHQHFVPKAYLKAWETRVRNSREPEKKFDGVYVFEGDEAKGEGITTKNVLWSQSLYTVKYTDYHYIHGKYPEIDRDFLSGIRNILDNTYRQTVLAENCGKQILTDQDLFENLIHLEEWDFKYADRNPAPKEKIINSITNLTSQCLEKGLDGVFERGWGNTRDSFISEVENVVTHGKPPYRISNEAVEEMARFFLSMLCRNPAFDSFGVYARVRERILEPVGMDEECINAIMHPQWLGELYRMVYGGSDGFFKLCIAGMISHCQMILIRRYDDASTFITSDNPAFRHISYVERENSNGFYFPLTPDYLLMIAKGNDGIEEIDYRYADDGTVRSFNQRIASYKTDKLISKQRYLPI